MTFEAQRIEEVGVCAVAGTDKDAASVARTPNRRQIRRVGCMVTSCAKICESRSCSGDLPLFIRNWQPILRNRFVTARTHAIRPAPAPEEGISYRQADAAGGVSGDDGVGCGDADW